MLDHAGFEALGIHLDGLAVGVDAGDDHAHVALDGHLEVAAEEREAPLGLGLGLVGALTQLRVDQDVDVPVGRHPVDEDAAKDAELRRGEADAVRLAHHLGHPLDEPLHVAVHLVDRIRGDAEDGIGVLAHQHHRGGVVGAALLVARGRLDLSVGDVLILHGHPLARSAAGPTVAYPSASAARKAACTSAAAIRRSPNSSGIVAQASWATATS